MVNQKSTKPGQKLNIDLIGICCSGLCAIHCLLTPFLLVLLPSLGQRFENQWVHIGFFVLIATIALLTIIRHRKMYSSKKIFGLLILGVLVTFIGFFPPQQFAHHHHAHDHFTHIFHWEEICFILGGLLLFVGHLLAIREYKCWEGHCHHHEEESAE